MTDACAHPSSTDGYCDLCGLRVGPGPSAQATSILHEVEEIDTSAAARQELCPHCQTPRAGDNRYCEADGYDFLSPPPAADGWEVIVTIDRRQFERYTAPGISFPEGAGSDRRIPLDADALLIGRARSGEPGPDIDLSQPPEDPGVSRRHAVLERLPDGGWGVRDLGSTNGTTINDDPDPVASDLVVPLAAGDRVRVGAFTTLTIRAL
jgi:hypothetical protein